MKRKIVAERSADEGKMIIGESRAINDGKRRGEKRKRMIIIV